MTAERPVRPRRSFIFSPGLRPEMFPKALSSGADIVCVELEDGIAPKDKATARARALSLFAEPQANDGVERIVRINCVRERFGLDDEKDAILEHFVSGGDLSKFGLLNAVTRTAQDVESYDRAIELERIGGRILELAPTEWTQN